MKLKTFLVLNAFVGAVSALTAILFGEKVLSMYGVDSNPSAILMGQYSALGTLAMALVAWFARNVEDMKAQGNHSCLPDYQCIWSNHFYVRDNFRRNEKRLAGCRNLPDICDWLYLVSIF